MAPGQQSQSHPCIAPYTRLSIKNNNFKFTKHDLQAKSCCKVELSSGRLSSSSSSSSSSSEREREFWLTRTVEQSSSESEEVVS